VLFPGQRRASPSLPAYASAGRSQRHRNDPPVEDEGADPAVAATALERNGYKILAASDGDAGLALAAEHKGPIHLLLSDGVLSGVRVPELLRRFVAQRPETKILLMSGFSQEAVSSTTSSRPTRPSCRSRSRSASSRSACGRCSTRSKKRRENRGLFFKHQREALAVLPAALPATLSNVRILILASRRAATLLATACLPP